MIAEREFVDSVTEEDFKIIRSLPPFNATSEAALREAFEHAGTGYYGIGDIVADEEYFPKGLCIVMKGVIVAENRTETHVIALNAFMKGDVFGAAALFVNKDSRYTSFVVAKRPTRLVVIPEEAIIKLISTKPKFAVAYSAFLTSKIRFLNRKISGYTAKSSVRALLQYLEVACAEDDDGVAKINISAVADELNMSRTTVYSAADTLEEAGFIKRDGKYYTLLRK